MTNDTLAHWVAPGAGGNAAEVPPVRPLWRQLAREPLVHFAVLGGLIFAADAKLHPPVKDDHVIVVTKAMQQSFIDGFDEDKEKKPTAEQLQKMIDAWVGSEILYREGKAMGVDKGDDMIRNRIAYKLQVMIFDQVEVERPSEEQLEAWFAKNHAQFDSPETVGFYITPPVDEATARRELADIQAGKEASDLQERTQAVLGRPVPSLSASYGDAFSDSLVKAPVGQWTVLQSKDGWHVVRLDSHHEGQRAKLDDVRDQAARIWHTDETRRRAWEAVNRLKAAYTVRIEH